MLCRPFWKKFRPAGAFSRRPWRQSCRGVPNPARSSPRAEASASSGEAPRTCSRAHARLRLSPQNVLAKALYDNVAESPDELSFRKGDIMTVLERDTQGLDGWWLCSLHGRQGIVPGNRLKILVGMHDKKPAGPGPGPPAPLAPAQPGLHNPTAQYTPMLPVSYPAQPDNVYLVPTPSKTQQGLYPAPGPSAQFQSPPAKQTSTFSKQMPHHAFPSPASDLYQVPPGPGNSTQDIYQVPPSAGIGQDIYQVPPSMDARSWEGTKPPAKVRPPWCDRAALLGVSPRPRFLGPAQQPRVLQGSGGGCVFGLGPRREVSLWGVRSLCCCRWA